MSLSETTKNGEISGTHSNDGVNGGTKHTKLSSFLVSDEEPLLKDKSTKKVYHQSGIYSLAIVFSNVNIGIGTIGLAYGISKSGWLLAIILFILCHSINHFTVFIMMEVASTMDVASYAIVCNKCGVPWLQIISDYSMVINKTLSCTGYFIIIGDYMGRVMSQVTDSPFWTDRHVWIVVFAIFFVIPTTSLRKLDALKNTSIIAMATFIYFVTVVQLFLWVPKLNELNDVTDKNISPFPVPDNPLEFFKTLSLFFYAYGGHPIAFGSTSELKNPTLSRIDAIIWMFCCFSTAIFCGIGFGGYFTFGSETMDNLLLNYPDDRIEIILVRVGMCIAVAFSFPVLSNAIKNSLASIIYGVGVPNNKYSSYSLMALIKRNQDYINPHSNHSVLDISKCKFFSLVFIVISIPFFVSILTDQLGVIFQFNGATVGTFNQVIFPALIYVFAYRNLESNKIREHKWSKIKLIISYGIIILGCIVMPLMVWFAIEDAINAE